MSMLSSPSCFRHRGLICFNALKGAIEQGGDMKISSVTCPNCRACYEVAESMTAPGYPGQSNCTVCGTFLTAWKEPRLRAFRLIVPPEHKYPRVPSPPPSYV